MTTVVTSGPTDPGGGLLAGFDPALSPSASIKIPAKPASEPRGGFAVSVAGFESAAPVSATTDPRGGFARPAAFVVVARCRAFTKAEWWNGHAAHAYTGTVRARLTHCQPVNCSAGTIAIAITGTPRTAAQIRRPRSAAAWSTGTASGSGIAAP